MPAFKAILAGTAIGTLVLVAINQYALWPLEVAALEQPYEIAAPKSDRLDGLVKLREAMMRAASRPQREAATEPPFQQAALEMPGAASDPSSTAAPRVGDNSVERLLLKTGFSIASGAFPESWPVLSENCARSLLGRGLRLIGVDAPSVDERHSKSLPVHKMIFSGNGCILENLDLRRIQPAAYELIAFPLKIMSLDAAPVRAILRDIE